MFESDVEDPIEREPSLAPILYVGRNSHSTANTKTFASKPSNSYNSFDIFRENIVIALIL